MIPGYILYFGPSGISSQIARNIYRSPYGGTALAEKLTQLTGKRAIPSRGILKGLAAGGLAYYTAKRLGAGDEAIPISIAASTLPSLPAYLRDSARIERILNQANRISRPGISGAIRRFFASPTELALAYGGPRTHPKISLLGRLLLPAAATGSVLLLTHPGATIKQLIKIPKNAIGWILRHTFLPAKNEVAKKIEEGVSGYAH